MARHLWWRIRPLGLFVRAGGISGLKTASDETPLAVEYMGFAKVFGPIVALNNVSFTLRRSEIYVLST